MLNINLPVSDVYEYNHVCQSSLATTKIIYLRIIKITTTTKTILIIAKNTETDLIILVCFSKAGLVSFQLVFFKPLVTSQNRFVIHNLSERVRKLKMFHF